MVNYKVVKNNIIYIKSLLSAELNYEKYNVISKVIAQNNIMLFATEKLNVQHYFAEDSDWSKAEAEIRSLIDIYEEYVEKVTGNYIDALFWKQYMFLKYVDSNVIYNIVVSNFKSLPESEQIEFLALPYRYSFLTGEIDIASNNYSLIKQYVEMLSSNVENYKWLYENLSDNKSKIVLNNIVYYWLNLNINALQQISEDFYMDYFDMDIVSCKQDDVFVDLGAYTGDTVRDFVAAYGRYKRIYAYELTPGTYDTLVNNTAVFRDVKCVQKAVGGKNEIKYVDDRKDCAGNKIVESGNTAIEVVCLDDDIKEPITIIKMDIEGAEKDAILGSKNHIINEKPKMLVSAYHLPADIFEIPMMIDKIRQDYKFYLRYNGHKSLWPCDFVLYAV